MSCTINSVSQSKQVFLPNYSIFSTAEYRRIKDALNVLGAKKLLFSDLFFLLHISTSRRNFFVFTKISYLQPFREIRGGGQGKSVTSTNDERRTTTTNDERRTTNYIDDHNTPSGFSESSG